MTAIARKVMWIGRTAALCLAAVVLVALTASADTAQAAKKKDKKVDKIVFSSDRTTGTGVDNLTGDEEIFVMNPDGTKIEQLTTNTVQDITPSLSPDGKEIAFVSGGTQSSNPQGETDVYLMKADGTNQENLTNTVGGILDFDPDFAPDGEEIAYSSHGVRPTNLEGDNEIYLMNADGSGQQNLTDTAGGIEDFFPAFSPDGKKIVYGSFGAQSSNPEGDNEVYVMKDNGSDQQNLTDTTDGVFDSSPDYSPSGEKIVYGSFGVQSSNPEGDEEIYVMKDDGSKQKNRTDTGGGVGDDFPDYSIDGKEIVYDCDGSRSTNPEGDEEVYVMDADGSHKQNLTNTGVADEDSTPDFGEAKK